MADDNNSSTGLSVVRLGKQYSKIWGKMAAVIFVFVVIFGNTAAECAVSDFAGTYSGTYSGDDHGKWTLKCNSQGTVLVVSWTIGNDSADGGTGAINAAGEFTVSMSEGAALRGKIDAGGKVTGSWTHLYEDVSGTFSGRKNLPHELAVFVGTYAGRFSGDASGSWTLAIDSEGLCNISSRIDSDPQSTHGYGIINYTGEFISEMENGVFQHGIIDSSGSVRGTWYDPEGGSGTFEGNREKVNQKPEVATGSATSVTAASAILNGTVNPKGSGTTYHFDYGTTPSYGKSTASKNADSGSAAITVSSSIAGLSAHTNYFYRIVASNTAGTSYGTNQNFTTAVGVPTAATRSTTDLEEDSATLNATVNPNGGATDFYFDYGLTDGYGSSTPNSYAGSLTQEMAVSAQIEWLLPATTYHFRIVATNEAGTAWGDDETFSTSILYVDSAGYCAEIIPCYTTVKGAMTAADPGATIRIVGERYEEDLAAGLSKALILSGGWDHGFFEQLFQTTVCTLTVKGAKIEANRIVVGCGGP